MENHIVFDGKCYNWDGKYYHGKTRLHRAVWIHYHGPIPKGFHIHHKDGNRRNNDIKNLGLMKASEHLAEHYKENWKDESFRERVRKHLREINESAKAWHASKEGHKWHKEHGIDGWKNKQSVIKTCRVCGKEYKTFFPSRSKFCHQNCKAKALRARRRLCRQNGLIDNLS
jgi:hypothetical protein